MSPLGRATRRRRRPPLVCAAAGWQLGTANLAAAGTVTCPMCGHPVAARAVRAGVVKVTDHPPAEAVTCPCGTVHARLHCPSCGQGIPPGEAVLHHLAVTDPPAEVAS